MPCTFSVVIPAYNEEEVIGALVEDLNRKMEELGEPFEILVVDDGSTDGTWEILTRISKKNAALKAFKLSRNFGHQAAFYAGMKMSEGQAVGLMDGDGQDPPEVIVKMFERWREGYDVVYGVRRKRKEGILKRLAYFAFYRILRKVANIEIPMDSGDFSVMDRRVVDFILSLEDRNPFLRGLRSWYGGRQLAFEYERAARRGGEPKYTWMKLINLSITGLTSFSKVPLRMSIYMGAITAIGAFSYAIMVVLLKLLFDYPPHNLYKGWSSLATLMAFLCGITMLLNGMAGEYITHIFDAVKKFPLFIIHESTADPGAKAATSGGPAENHGNEPTDRI